jgi:phage terminase small subunit
LRSDPPKKPLMRLHLRRSAERVLAELAKVGFADITSAAKWGAALALKDPETGGVEIAQGVELVPSADLPPNVSAAISEVKKTKEGISIKFHDKLGALEKIGKELARHVHRSPAG